jgi:hypothetical protein
MKKEQKYIYMIPVVNLLCEKQNKRKKIAILRSRKETYIHNMHVYVNESYTEDSRFFFNL